MSFLSSSSLTVSSGFRAALTKVSPHVPVLYKEFHTPDLVLQRSQFLCTV